MENVYLEFLERCLSEDEQWARAASQSEDHTEPDGNHWHWEETDRDRVCVPDVVTQTYVGDDHDAGRLSLRSVEEYPTRCVGALPYFAIHFAEEIPVAVGGHIIRHDPARVLADVAAKREILAAHRNYYGDGDDLHWPVSVIRLLAAGYKTRPGYPA